METLKLTRGMLKDIKRVKLDAGMYSDAENKNISFTNHVEDELVKKGVMGPTPYFGMTPPEILHIKRSAIKEGRNPEPDMMDILMDVHEINTRGWVTDIFQKFFLTADSRVLLPEYISSRVFSHQYGNGLYDKLIQATYIIRAYQFTKFHLNEDANQRNLSLIGDGATMPRTQIKAADYSARLRPYGKIVEWDYDVLEYSPINLLEPIFQKIAQDINRAKTDQVIYHLINGDGSISGWDTANYTISSTTSGFINKTDIIGMASVLDDGYQANVFVGKKLYMRKFWETMSTMTNPVDQKKEIGVPIPTGYRWDGSTLTDDILLVLDNRYAIAEVTNSLMFMSESDKVITARKFENVISIKCVFPILDRNAIGGMDVVH